jgi:hypothetical protein
MEINGDRLTLTAEDLVIIPRHAASSSFAGESSVLPAVVTSSLPAAARPKVIPFELTPEAAAFLARPGNFEVHIQVPANCLVFLPGNTAQRKIVTEASVAGQYIKADVKALVAIFEEMTGSLRATYTLGRAFRGDLLSVSDTAYVEEIQASRVVGDRVYTKRMRADSLSLSAIMLQTPPLDPRAWAETRILDHELSLTGGIREELSSMARGGRRTEIARTGPELVAISAPSESGRAIKPAAETVATPPEMIVYPDSKSQRKVREVAKDAMRRLRHTVKEGATNVSQRAFKSRRKP